MRASKINNVIKLLYSSSACIYNTDLQKETFVHGLKEEQAYPANPEDGYGWEKLFSERMDIDGTVDLLKAIQSGIVCVEQRSPGRLGVSPRTERDMQLPDWSNVEVRNRLEGRLLNERVLTICLRCQATTRFRVARYSEIEKKCTVCNATMRAVAREGLDDELKKWVKSDESKIKNRMKHIRSV